jgi:hypothetical protein
MEKILEIVGEEQITGYQLRDIFDEHKDLTVVKRKLAAVVNQNVMIAKGLLKEKSSEIKKDEDKDKKDFPTNDIEGMLKQFGFQDTIPKLKEHDIADPEVFFGLTEDEILELLEIKTQGKKFRFKEKLKELKDKHEKAKAKKAAMADDMVEIVTETFEMLKKKSTIIF